MLLSWNVLAGPEHTHTEPDGMCAGGREGSQGVRVEPSVQGDKIPFSWGLIGGGGEVDVEKC